MICIVDCGTSYIDELKKYMSEFNCQSRVISLEETEKCDFKEFSGIIITGASILLTQTDLQKYLDSFRFIKEVNVPVLGICLGHQIIGLLYGSEVFRGKKVDKKEQIEILKQSNLFLEIENSSLFQEEHSEYITLPEEFLLLAKSSTCNNEAMKHKQKKIYGVQFHPEVSGDSGKTVLRNFVNICSKHDRI